MNIPRPIAPIGAQDLIKKKPCFYGLLRKRYKGYQAIRATIGRSWSLKFVVLHGGCLYYFKNEWSMKAIAVSLFGYNQVLRDVDASGQDIYWSFKIFPVLDTFETFHFSATSESSMKEWMMHVKHHLEIANNIFKNPPVRIRAASCDGSASSDQGYHTDGLDECEMPIYDDHKNVFDRKRAIPPRYQEETDSYDGNDEGSDDDSHRYEPPPEPKEPLPRTCNERPLPSVPPVPPRRSRPNETSVSPNPPAFREIRRHHTSVDIPTEQNLMSTQCGGNSEQRPPIAKKPTRSVSCTIYMEELKKKQETAKDEEQETDATTFWNKIYYYGTREESNTLITDLATEGVYLVRRMETYDVLEVYLNDSAHKLRIMQKDRQWHLKAAPGLLFNTVFHLIDHFYFNDLPGIGGKLTMPYFQHETYDFYECK